MPITKVIFVNEWEGNIYTKEIKSTEFKFLIERCDSIDSTHEFLSLIRPEGWQPTSITVERGKSE